MEIATIALFICFFSLFDVRRVMMRASSMMHHQWSQRLRTVLVMYTYGEGGGLQGIRPMH